EGNVTHSYAYRGHPLDQAGLAGTPYFSANASNPRQFSSMTFCPFDRHASLGGGFIEREDPTYLCRSVLDGTPEEACGAGSLQRGDLGQQGRHHLDRQARDEFRMGKEVGHAAHCSALRTAPSMGAEDRQVMQASPLRPRLFTSAELRP